MGLVEHRNSIWNIDYLKYGEVRNAGLSIYSDALFDEISKAVRYQYSTIVSFNLLLKDIGKEDALYIDIFQKNEKEVGMKPLPGTIKPIFTNGVVLMFIRLI